MATTMLRCPQCKGHAHEVVDGAQSYRECTHGCGWKSCANCGQDLIYGDCVNHRCKPKGKAMTVYLVEVIEVIRSTKIVSRVAENAEAAKQGVKEDAEGDCIKFTTDDVSVKTTYEIGKAEIGN